MSSELACLDEIKGRCLAIGINWPDTGVRVRPAIEQIDHFLNLAVKGEQTQRDISLLAEELYSLRDYLREILGEYPEVKPDFAPTIKAIDYLLEPVSK